MSDGFKKGLAWFFAVMILLSGLMTAAATSISSALPSLLIGGGWCFYLYYVAGKGKHIEKAEALALEHAMAQPLTQIKPQQALLKPDEKAYGAIAAQLMEEKTVGYSAGTQGVSFKVAKGLTLRSSGTRAKAVKGVVAVANGELVITDKRVIFAGDRKSFAIANDDLLNTTNYSDGFGFTDGNKTYTLTTAKGSDHTMFAVAVHKVLRT